jgi:dTMP kinase
MTRNLELETWKRVAGLAQSPSHDFQHIDRVQAYIDMLGRALGVNTELVRIAAILHDLGRGDQTRRHGTESIEASKEMAEEVLRNLPLSDGDRRLVIEAIEGHDQPEFHSDTPAVRILKDADFLAGFGAWGVLRIAMWSGETGRRVDDVIGRMTSGMQRRMQSLEFSESRDIAMRELLFTKQFVGELDRSVNLLPRSYLGFYCVIEGVSGVGKNTIAEGLCKQLTEIGLGCSLIYEPGETYRELRKHLPDGASEGFVPLKKALLMADRAEQVRALISPALARGEVVIAVRSYLSTAVYQSSDYAEAYRTMLEHDWVPRCDLLLLLDVDTETALNRIKHRNKPAGEFESSDQLNQHRIKYRNLATSFPTSHFHVIDTSRPQSEVADEAFNILRGDWKLTRAAP